MWKNKSDCKEKEFDYSVEEYEKILDEFEEDRKTNDFSIPEEWNKNFRKVMDDTLKIRAKQKRRKRIEKVACALLAVGLGANLLTTSVEGTSLMDYFKNAVSTSKLNHEMSGTVEQTELLEEIDTPEIHYEGETIQEVFHNIHADRKSPMFYFSDVLDEYEITEAKYNHIFQILNITLKTSNGYIHITEEFLYDNIGSGTYYDHEEISTIYNDSFSMEIPIYNNTENSSQENYYFSVILGQSKFIFDGATTLDKCESIAKTLYFE